MVRILTYRLIFDLKKKCGRNWIVRRRQSDIHVHVNCKRYLKSGGEYCDIQDYSTFPDLRHDYVAARRNLTGTRV